MKIVTIEDPIENLVDGVDQIQTHEQIGLTFESLLRRVLRQDPDIIMIGEIRDTPTADLAIRAALTGQLVLTTLHTNDAVSIVTRLIDMGIEPFLLAEVMKGCVAQRLVRKVCEHCAKTRKPNAFETRLFERFSIEAKSLSEGAGCPQCHGSGYSGRFGLAESFSMNSRIAEMVTEKATESEIRTYLQKQSSGSLLENGLYAAAEGRTTVREIEKAISFDAGIYLQSRR